MKIEYQMGPIGYNQSIFPAKQALCFILGQLFEQTGQMDDDTVAYLLRVKDGMQLIKL